MATVNLGSKGLSSGGQIDPYLDSYWNSGDTVIIPGGSYQLDDGSLLGVEADQNSTIRGEGTVELDVGSSGLGRPNHEARGCILTVANITIRGTYTGDSKVKPLVENGGTVNYAAFNQPDKPQADIDYAGFLLDRDSEQGTVNWDGCEVAWATNNGIYTEYNPGVTITVRNSRFYNINVDAIRCGASSDGDLVENCLFIVDASPMPFEEGATTGGITGRAVRQVRPGPVTIRNCDAVFSWDDAAPFFKTNDSAEESGEVILENNTILHNGSGRVLRGPIESATGSGNTLTGSNTEIADEFESVMSCIGDECPRPDASWDGVAGGRRGAAQLSRSLTIENIGTSAVSYNVETSGGIQREGLLNQN